MSTSKTPYPTLAQAALFVLVGTIFGTGLQRGRVHEASLVIGQMTFQHFVMLKMFLTACATSICAFLVIERVFKVQTLRSTYREDFGRGIPAVITGSSLLGLGMTLTGSCPGTVFAQLGAGSTSAPIILAGAFAGSYLFSHVSRALERSGSTFLIDGKLPKSRRCLVALLSGDESATPASATGLRVAGSIAVALYTVVIALELLVHWRTDIASVVPASTRWPAVVPPIVAGLCVGAAQFVGSLMTGKNLGSSTSYGCIVAHCAPDAKDCSYLSRVAHSHRFQVLVMTGVTFGAWLSARASDAVYVGAPSVGALRLFVGGALLTFGAQMGGGCTSGHGISGLPYMSTYSAVAVAAMFGTAILSGIALTMV